MFQIMSQTMQIALLRHQSVADMKNPKALLRLHHIALLRQTMQIALLRQTRQMQEQSQTQTF